MKTLLLNIGNTHTQVAECNGDSTPRLLCVLETEKITATGSLPYLDTCPAPWNALAVSVVPAAQRVLTLKYQSSIRFLTARDFPQLDFSQVDSTTLGMDRIANAVAAYSLVKGAATVIDFGTCVNTVSVNAKGRFLGGAILPGRLLLRKALRLYTAQLPLVPLGKEVPSPLGTNTQDAMSAGLDIGILGAVQRLLAETREALGGQGVVLPTGGDAPFFLHALPELLSPAPELLTLRGVAAALNHE